jgi:hypothetical protein
MGLMSVSSRDGRHIIAGRPSRSAARAELPQNRISRICGPKGDPRDTLAELNRIDQKARKDPISGSAGNTGAEADTPQFNQRVKKEL